MVVTYDLDGMSRFIDRLWIECNHADDPNPRTKLAQAVRDIARAKAKGRGDRDLPWVVWRETGCRQVWVTTEARVLYEIEGFSQGCAPGDYMVTISWEDAVRLLGLAPAG